MNNTSTQTGRDLSGGDSLYEKSDVSRCYCRARKGHLRLGRSHQYVIALHGLKLARDSKAIMCEY